MRNASVFLLSLILGCVSIPIDPGMSALSGGEPTVIFRGCNRKLSKGYLFCETKEASQPTLTQVEIIVPVVQCKKEACIEYRVIKPDGNVSLTGSILQGVSSVVAPLSSWLGHESPLADSDEGEYLLQMRVFFEVGKDQVSESLFGFLRLKVWNEAYFPVPCNSPHHAYTTVINPQCQIQYTSKLRAALCGTCDVEGDR